MLETIWFVLWALLWAMYFILDGFDLGIGSLLPFAARNEGERRVMFNATGPFWDGNEVWLISAGGVTFAAFPKTYAVMFSALYVPLLLLLFTLSCAQFPTNSGTRSIILPGVASGTGCIFSPTLPQQFFWALPLPTSSVAFPLTPTESSTAISSPS